MAFVVAHHSGEGIAFADAPRVDIVGGEGTLRFTPGGDAFGIEVFRVTLVDDGGTAFGGVDTSGAIFITITVVAVNDAPVFSAVWARYKPQRLIS